MDDIVKILGKRIRNYRMQLDLSQEKLAEKASCHPTYIGQIERGDRKMSIDTLANISDSLNVSADYLLYGYTYYMQNISVLEAFDDLYKESIDEELRELLAIFRGSSKEQISLMQDICKLILPSIKK